MYNDFIKGFMLYDQKIRFSDAIKKILKPKHYFYLTTQVLTFTLLIIPQLLTVTNWPLYNIAGLILLLPTVAAFSTEASLIILAFDYYYIFPSLTNREKDILRKNYRALKNRTESI